MIGRAKAAWRAVICLACAIVTLGTMATAQAETTLEKAKRLGYIRVGFANEAPAGYATPDGKLTGESPEIVRAVLKKLGINEIDGVLTEFGSLIPGLQAGRFDIIAASMFILPKRCQQVQFSEPIDRIGQALLVKKGNPKAIKDYGTVAANKDLKLAVMAGAVEVGYAKDAGVDQSQVMVLPDQSSLADSVRSGRVDAAALTSISIANLVAKSDDLEATPQFDAIAGKSVAGHSGIAFRKEDKDLYEAFNAELKKFVGSSEHLALVEPFGFGKDFLPTKTTAQLCAGE
jgi:polar amino acid transport system substrate-binding protein